VNIATVAIAEDLMMLVYVMRWTEGTSPHLVHVSQELETPAPQTSLVLHGLECCGALRNGSE
jgi:hypothetical protein